MWREHVQRMPLDTVWVDCVDPSHAEISMVEAALGIDIPTLSEMEAIVPSKRLREEQGAVYATLFVPVEDGVLSVKLVPITCILARDIVLTVRYAPIPLIEAYFAHSKHPELASQPPTALFIKFFSRLLDGIADLLERITEKVDVLSHDIFRREEEEFRATRTASISILLQRIGMCGEGTASLRDSLVGFELCAAFLTSLLRFSEEVSLKTLEKDILALKDLSSFLSNKVSFLLNATLGLVNLRQNDIIKIFSVVSVVFLPPTLLTGLWGMNFEYMPELQSAWSYPVALCVILASAVMPYLYCKRKRWL